MVETPAQPPQPPNTQLVTLLRQAHAILVFTGAGISTSSGIPDYRGPDGVWKVREPVYYDDFMSSEASRVEYWQQKASDWEDFRDAQATPVHHAVVALQEAGKLARVVTQNVDGLHSLAGLQDECLIEIHGTNRMIECQECHERTHPQAHYDAFAAVGSKRAPRCRCGGYLKPATISFGQSLREADLHAAAAAAQMADLVIAMGSSLVVQPAASIPLLAARAGAPYVIINRGHTDHDHNEAVTLRLDGDVQSVFAPAVEVALVSAMVQAP